jgi:hypothetical protein
VSVPASPPPLSSPQAESRRGKSRASAVASRVVIVVFVIFNPSSYSQQE